MLEKSHVQNKDGMVGYKKREVDLANAKVPVDRIREQILATCYGQIAYEIFFREYKIEPYRLSFEDFIADKEGTCRKVLAWLGIAYPEKALKDEYLSTHSPINDKWHQGMLKGRLEIL